MKLHEITQASTLFDEIYTMLIAVAGICQAAYAKKNGSLAGLKEGDYLTVEAGYLNSKVRLPLVGPIESALSGRKPDMMQITVVPGLEKEVDHGAYHTGFLNPLMTVINSCFVSYYERHVDRIRTNHGESDRTWPAVWQMAWVIRNAAAHDGTVFIRNKNRPPVKWRNLEFTPDDTEKKIKVVGPILTAGDLILILLEMESVLKR